MLRSTPRRLGPIVIFMAATLLLFAAMTSLADFPLLDTMWHASADEIHRTVSNLTAEQVRAYRLVLVVDFFYAIAYTGLLVLLFRSFGSNRGFCDVLRRVGIAATATAGLSDYLENGMVLAVLSALPGESPLARALGTVTTAKWIAVATAGVLLGAVALGRRARA